MFSAHGVAHSNAICGNIFEAILKQPLSAQAQYSKNRHVC